MAYQYRLSAEAQKAYAEVKREATQFLGVLDNAKGTLEDEAEAHGEHFMDSSLTYQATDRGLEVEGWIGALNELVDFIDQAHSALREIEDVEFGVKP